MNDQEVWKVIVDSITKLSKDVNPSVEFDDSTMISALGIDSVRLMEIIGDVQDEVGIYIPEENFAKLQTVGDIKSLILEHSSTS